MPSRLVTLGILVFWLATTAWFVARDLLPNWSSQAAPPFSIELADEAIRQIVPVHWQIRRDGQAIGRLRTTLRSHDEDDTYELTAACQDLPLVDTTAPVVGRIQIVIRQFEDRLRVTRDGELRSMRTAIALDVHLGSHPPLPAEAALSAEVRGRRMVRAFRLSSPGLGEFAPALDSTEPIRGSVLNPLHPLHRLSGLRPGQRWRQPLVAPHEEIIQAALAKAPGAESAAPAFERRRPRWLDAAVRPQFERLEWNRGEVDCLVVDYRSDWHSDDLAARTWIRATDGLILRQEAESHGQSLTLERE
jgi:hypothetical protein